MNTAFLSSCHSAECLYSWGPTYPPPQVLLLAPHTSPSYTFSDKWIVRATSLVWPGPWPQSCLTQSRQFRKWLWLMAFTRSRSQNPGGGLLCRGGSAETNLTPTFCRSSKCLQSWSNGGAMCHSCAICLNLKSQWNANWFPAGRPPWPHISLTKESLPWQ